MVDSRNVSSDQYRESPVVEGVTDVSRHKSPVNDRTYVRLFSSVDSSRTTVGPTPSSDQEDPSRSSRHTDLVLLDWVQ